MRRDTGTKNTIMVGKQKTFFFPGFRLAVLILFTPVLFMTCDTTSMWDYLDKDLIASRLVVSKTALTVKEYYGSDYFSVSMQEQPTDLVIVALSVSDITKARIQPTPPDYNVLPANTNYDGPHLEFTPQNWKTEQTVYIYGEPDSRIKGPLTSQCNLQTLSADKRYNGFTLKPVTITTLDQDVVKDYYQYEYTSGTFASIKNESGTQSVLQTNLDNQYNINYVYPFSTDFFFTFIGKVFTSVTINSNGLLKFIHNPATDDTTESAVLFAANTDPEYVIAPWWDDLVGNTLGFPNSQIYTLLSGTHPDRILTIEWHRMSIKHLPGAWVTFQVKLYETSNKIELVYGDRFDTMLPTPTPTITPSGTPGPITSDGAAIGLKGEDQDGGNFIDGINGDNQYFDASHSLQISDFPDIDTVISFTPN